MKPIIALIALLVHCGLSYGASQPGGRDRFCEEVVSYTSGVIDSRCDRTQLQGSCYNYVYEQCKDSSGHVVYQGPTRKVFSHCEDLQDNGNGTYTVPACR